LNSVLAAQGVGLLLTFVASSALIRAVGLDEWRYSLTATAAFAVVCAVALGYLHQHPFAQFGSANLATTGRAVLVSMVIACIGETRSPSTAWTAALGGTASTLLDGVDGWLARRSGMSSDFGARYDMEIDALLILALAVLAWQHEKAGGWIILAGAMRYLFVAAGYVWPWMNASLPPSTRRKAVCVIQIVGLILAVSPLVPAPTSAGIGLVTLVALIWSFSVDVGWLWQHGI
jgi:phosphatidylglycerophosphate synthase